MKPAKQPVCVPRVRAPSEIASNDNWKYLEGIDSADDSVVDEIPRDVRFRIWMPGKIDARGLGKGAPCQEERKDDGEKS